MLRFLQRFEWLTIPLIVGCLFVVTQQVGAATLSNRRDVMSREQVAVVANHEIKFVTPSGVDAPTDTLVLTFASGFSLASMGAGDIDLLHGPITGLETNETLAVAAAAGVWGVSVAGQTITFTAPTNAALGEIAADDVVTIRLGLNASGATKQIVNPVASSTYSLAIGGTFGDVGSFAIPIGGGDGLSVSATVAAADSQNGQGSCGSDCPQPARDTAPPTISDLRVLSVTTSTASLDWTTGEPAICTLAYHMTSSTAISKLSLSQVTSTMHAGVLRGLTADRDYLTSARCSDSAFNMSTTTEVSFHTLALPRGPVIISSGLENIGEGGADIVWKTDVVGTSRVEYGRLGSVMNQSASTSEMLLVHRLALTGLMASTTYRYRIVTQGEDGLITRSADLNFSTLRDEMPPANVSNLEALASDRVVGLTWTNPSDADFINVLIRASIDTAPTSTSDGRLVYQGTSDRFSDRNLTNGTRYVYRVFSRDRNGNVSSGALVEAVPFRADTQRVEDRPRKDVTPQERETESLPVILPTTNLPSAGPGPRIISLPPLSDVASSTLPASGNETEATTTHSAPSSVEPTPQSFEVFFDGLPGRFGITANAQGRLIVWPGQTVLVRIPTYSLGATPQSGEVRIGASRFALVLSPDGTAWTATVTPVAKSGESELTVTLQFTGGNVESGGHRFISRPLGRVLEEPLGAARQPLDGAQVELLGGDGQRVQVMGGSNPYETDKSGTYFFPVMSGKYTLVVKKTGFREMRIEIDHRAGVVSQDVVLIRQPVKLSAVIQANAGTVKNVQAVAQQMDLIVEGALQNVRTPEIQQIATQVAMPTILTLAVANSATAVSAFNIINYIRFLFTQPFLLIKRRKRRSFGTVYHALSKLPVELAIVRLYAAEKQLLLQTRITDAKGRYSFSVKPGRYRLQVIKPSFTFPTTLLKSEKQDVNYLDLYHGEVIEFKAEGTLALNVPLDPAQHEEQPVNIVIKRVLRHIQDAMGLVGVLVSMGAVVISPTPLMGGLLIGQVGIYLLFRRLAVPPKPKKWGLISDEKTGKPLERSIVRIFDKKFNKLLETQITDRSGKYGFFVGKNVYFVTAEHGGYAPYRSPDIDLQRQDSAVIEQQIKLVPRAA